MRNVNHSIPQNIINIVNVLIGVHWFSVLLQSLTIIHVSPVVFLLYDHKQGDHSETADREDITEPLSTNVGNVEEGQEKDSDDVVPIINPTRVSSCTKQGRQGRKGGRGTFVLSVT